MELIIDKQTHGSDPVLNFSQTKISLNVFQTERGGGYLILVKLELGIKLYSRGFGIGSRFLHRCCFYVKYLQKRSKMFHI
jgi:hypothetical protein